MAVDPGQYIAYADGEISAANSYLIKLAEATANLGAPVIDPQFPTNPATPTLSLPVAPAGSAIVWSAPGLPAAFTDSLNVDDIMPAPFDEDPPELIFGSVPTFTDVAPDAPGIDTSYVMPDLAVSLPAAPSLLSLNISQFDGVTIPTVDFSIPTLTLDAPSIREYVPGALYTSSVLTAVQNKLLTALDDTSTGLGAEVEQAIWDRGREREAIARANALAEIDRMEELGFALPPGVYVDARIKVATDADANDRGLSREVMIKEAELEQSNVHHALDVAVQLEGKLIDYTNQVEQRFFESCRYATEAGVQIYNARVQAYGVTVEAYKARVTVYDAQVRGALATVEAYRAQIAAEQAKADINRTLVEQYKVQIDAALSAVEIFKAKIAAIQAKADIEKTKIEIFGEQVRAYAAKVSAFTAGVEGFRATIQAEETKQEAFKTKVQVYSAEVDAASKLIDARIKAFEGRIQAKTVEYDGYKAAVAAESSRIQGLVSSDTAKAEVYKATVSGYAAYNDSLTKQWQATIEQAARIAEIGVSAAKANAELYVTVRQAAIESAKTGATVSAQLGSAALNAINWHSTESTSSSDSTSTSTSTVTSDSTSSSTSTNYNYNV
jgi:hypothetical protein